jgi:acetylornithine deacetylase/succinyl-diaminopimelate desuccinylase-like protein
MSFDFLEEAQRLIAIDSISAKGTAAIAEHVAEVMAPMDLEVRLEEVLHRGVRQVNVIAEKGPATRDDLLLNTHLDTVPPGDCAAWTACEGRPFRAVVDGDRIYGLGSADAKLDFLCKLKALEGLKGTTFRHRAALVGTFGEEIGLVGARELVDRGYFNFAHALVGEPSSLHPIFAHKGLAVWGIALDLVPGAPPPEERVEMMEVIFRGERAHASTPAFGRNAILTALDCLVGAGRRGRTPRVYGLTGGTASNVVPDRCALVAAHDPAFAQEAQAAGARIEPMGLRAGRPLACAEVLADVIAGLRDLEARFSEPKDDAFDPPVTTFNPGLIKCHEGTVELVFECRPIPELAFEEISEEVGRMNDRLSTQHPSLSIQVENLRYNPAMKDARGGGLYAAAVDTLREIDLPSEGWTKPTCTEAAVYSQLGIDTIVFGPGVSEGNAHRSNEHNLLSHCKKAIAFYSRVIERLCVRG